MSVVPSKLRIQFTKQYMEYLDKKGIYFSDKCCLEFKKNIFYDIEKKINRFNTFTGMRKEEGGRRNDLKCIQKSHNGDHINILSVVSEEWEQQFIDKYKIDICVLYKHPYNLERTGCKSCPYSLHIQEQLDNLYKVDEKLYWQSVNLWKPVYDEYIRLGYRLKYYPHLKPKQITIFDLMDEKENEY